MRRLHSSLCLRATILIGTLTIFLPATCYAQSVSADLDEAQAAYHLGFLKDKDEWTSYGLVSSWSLTERALADSSVPDSLRMKAWRLRHLIAGQLRDASLYELTTSSIPSSVAGLTIEEWQRQKLLWRLLYLGGIGDWSAVRDEGNSLLLGPSFEGANLSDFNLISSQTEIRFPQTQTAGYQRLVEEIVNGSRWGQLDVFYNPYYGRQELLLVEEIRSWEMLKQILTSLSNAAPQNLMAARRWFELASPSFDPTVNNFPEAPAADLTLLESFFQSQSSAFLNASANSYTSNGGYRQLLYHSICVDDMRSAGKYAAITQYVDSLPSQISGIHERIWNAYKISWKSVGLVGLLAFADINALAPNIEAASQLLPMPQNCIMVGGLGVSRLRTLKPEGLLNIASYFASDPTDMRLNSLVFREMLVRMKNLPLAECREILISAGERPVPLIARSTLGLFHAQRAPDNQKNQILDSALRDGVAGLHALEITRDPRQIHVREFLLPKLAAGLKEVSEGTQGELALQNSNLLISNNPELSTFLASNASPVPENLEPLRRSSIFTSLASVIASKENDSFIIGFDDLSAPNIASLVRKIPPNYSDRQEVVAVARICQKAYQTGQTTLGLTNGEWEKVEVRRAELMLGRAEHYAQGLSVLQVVAARPPNPTDALSRAERRRAMLAVTALSDMNNLESYRWAINWISLIEEREGVPEMRHLASTLSLKLEAAYQRQDVQAFLNSTEMTPKRRNMNRLMIGYALMRADEYRKAVPIFEHVRTDSTLPEDSELRRLAESWQSSAWENIANTTSDQNERQVVLNHLVTRGKQRAEVTRNERLHRQLLVRAIWAARELNDSESERVLEAIRQQIIEN